MNAFSKFKSGKNLNDPCESKIDEDPEKGGR